MAQKQAKPGKLRRFAAYPRCWVDTEEIDGASDAI